MKIPLVTIVLAVLLLVALPASALELHVVTLYSPPLAYEKNNNVTGIGTEIVREGLKRIGVDVNFTIMPWKRALFMARFGEADAIFYAVKNKEREKWFHYPEEPLVVEATVPMRRAGESVVISPDRFHYRHYRLGIGRGYYYGPKLKRFLDRATFAKVEEATTIESNFNKLIEGRIDVFLADSILAKHFIKKRSARDLVEIVKDADGKPVILDSVDSFLAFSKETVEPDIAVRFSDALKGMKKDGTYDRIFETFTP